MRVSSAKIDRCEHGVEKFARTRFAANCRKCLAAYNHEYKVAHGLLPGRTRCDHGIEKNIGAKYATRCPDCISDKSRAAWAALKAERRAQCEREARIEAREAQRRGVGRCTRCGHGRASHELMRDGHRGPCEVGLRGSGVNEVICPCEEYRKREANHAETSKQRHAA